MTIAFRFAAFSDVTFDRNAEDRKDARDDEHHHHRGERREDRPRQIAPQVVEDEQ